MAMPRLTVVRAEPLFKNIASEGAKLPCWMSHGDKVLAPPPGFAVAATTASTPVAAMCDEARHLYGVQFHPEVAHTPFGAELLRAFVMGPCGCQGTWTPANFVEEAISQIRATGGHGGCGVRRFRRHRQLLRGRADAQGDWRSTDVHFCGSRPAAAGRSRAGAGRFRRRIRYSTLSTPMRGNAFWRNWQA